MLPVWRPNWLSRLVKIRPYGSGRAARRRDHKHLDGGLIALAYRVGNPIPHGRIAWAGSLTRDSTVLPTKDGNDVNASAIAIRSKSDLAAIGGERRLVVIRDAVGEPQRLASGHLPDPDVEASVFPPVGGIGQQFSIGREGRFSVKSR